MIAPLCKEKDNQELRDKKIEKMLHCLWNFIYFSCSSLWAYTILKDEPYLPWLLGGSGNVELSLLSSKDNHFVDHNPKVRLYLLVTMGYHFGCTLSLLLTAKRNDFVEMALHHVVTVYLYIGSYLFNIWEISATIAFLHDIADVFV